MKHCMSNLIESIIMPISRNKEKWLPSLIFFILYTTSQTRVVQGGATKSVLFEKVSSTNQSLQALTSYTDKSRLSCASLCLSSVKKRGYFTHNPAQQTCACGVTLLQTPLAPGESLYAPKCDVPGYTQHVLGSARLCLKFVNKKVDFSTAKSTCAKDGSAYLFMADSQEKLDLAKLLGPGDVQIWVGMDDIEKEGVFRWVDGRLVTDRQMDLFSVGEPSGGGEDCAATFAALSKLNDRFCQLPAKFICEIPTE